VTIREVVAALESAANRRGWDSLVWLGAANSNLSTLAIWTKPADAGPKRDWLAANKAAADSDKERK